MATFSPAPRRTSRLRTPASPPRRTRLGAGSRLTTPIRALSDNDSSSPGLMDVDGNTSTYSDQGQKAFAEATFARSKQLLVSFYASLPIEVSHILKSTEFQHGSYSGDIDISTGFSVFASASTCFVWQHAQALKGIPTCYIFSCPDDITGVPPLYALVPYNSHREPGLILVSISGKVWFWESIGIGLAGGERYTTFVLELSGSIVTNLIRTDPQTYLVSTSNGAIFRLILTSTGGTYHLLSRAFAPPTQTTGFSRLIPFWGTQQSSTGMSPTPGNINSIALGANVDAGRQVWALVGTRIQGWNMSPQGWEELFLDEDVSFLIRDRMRRVLGNSIEQDNAKLDLELVDMAVEELKDDTQTLVVLASYAGLEDDSMMSMDFGGDSVHRNYAILHLTCTFGVVKAKSVTKVPHQTKPFSDDPIHPRIKLMKGGDIIVVQFGEAIALCARDSLYSERLALKSKTDCAYGVGVQSNSILLVLTGTTMMKVVVDLDFVIAFDPVHGRAGLIKTIMTQAILYGASPTNPLQFTFPPNVDEESLMRGAEQLSAAVLESDPEIVPRNHDLTAQLVGRKERLGWLIRFINDNYVLEKLSQSCRQKLASDAEKLYAAHQLWLQHNDFLTVSQHHSVLTDVVYSYMSDIQATQHDDLLRAFFRLHIRDLGVLISKITETMISTTDNRTGRDVPSLLYEANQITLIVLQAAFEYRDYNSGVYGVTLPMINTWTSDPAIIGVLATLFETTVKYSSSAEEGDSYMQIPTLASVLFTCTKERITSLRSISLSNDALEKDRLKAEQEFTESRPKVLETLRRVGHSQSAFSLAEKYRDFSSLVDLCHKDTIYPPERNPNASRIQRYIELFQEDFTFELYQWYMQHGELRVMFSHDASHADSLSAFFQKRSFPRIAWIHELGLNRQEDAARSLLNVASNAPYLEDKHLMLSIGKLAHLAHLQETQAPADDQLLEDFHDQLDFVGVHETMVNDLRSIQGTVRGRRSLESQIDKIVRERASSLSDRPTLALIFRNLVRDLLQGHVLAVEDTADVLTLQDTDVDGYGTSLQLLNHAKNIPQSRKLSAKRTVWRRIYMHDDWATLRDTNNVSDMELNDRFRETALYHTLASIVTGEQRAELELMPGDAAIIPSESDISSRWPGFAGDQVEDVVQDYKFERDAVRDLEIEDMYARIRGLVLMDLST